jgi:hypothetical protein
VSNVVEILVPNCVAAVIIPTAIKAAIRPYSIAVAPDSSFMKREKRVFHVLILIKLSSKNFIQLHRMSWLMYIQNLQVKFIFWIAYDPEYNITFC